MLVSLTIQNFKAFLEETTISFAAGTTTKLSGNLLRHKNGERFVKAMALYGYNASGKTSILDALYAMKTFVLVSAEDRNPKHPIPFFESFALDQENSRRPTKISVTVEQESHRFTYEVQATKTQVWSELLILQKMSKKPSRRTVKKVLLNRVWSADHSRYDTTIDSMLASELTRDSVVEQTTPNRLMVGKLASMNSSVAKRIVEWFDEDLALHDMHRNPDGEEEVLADSAQLMKENSNYWKLVSCFMKDADTGIRDLHIDDEDTFKIEFSDGDKNPTFKKGRRPGIFFQHTTSDGSEAIFERKRESSGTQRFIALITAYLRPSQRRRLVCIDELSASLHPLLVDRLIRIFQSSRFNPIGNQLLFTTHDTNLMGGRAVLRRDQIVICEKDEFGRSRAVRLDEFQDLARSDANLQQHYLQGRFGGLPQFGPTFEDVESDDNPLEVDGE